MHADLGKIVIYLSFSCISSLFAFYSIVLAGGFALFLEY